MNRFYLEFQNDIDTQILEFEVYDSSVATKWFQELNYIIGLGSSIREPKRMYGFNNGQWNEQYIVDKINESVDLINTWTPIINVRAIVDAPDTLCNILHKYFEEMRGGVLTPGTTYTNAPNQIKRAIEDYNVWIHALENFTRTSKSEKSRPRLVITFENFRRHPLDDSDYDNFSLDTKFGEVYINYCEVGKPLFDVFVDQDDIVGDDNIRPLKYYSAEMMVYFFNSSLTPMMPSFWSWWDTNNEYLTNLGFTKYDKKLAIGKIPVAKLVTTQTNNELVNNISRFTQINRVYI